jgi:hypothetical protein
MRYDWLKIENLSVYFPAQSTKIKLIRDQFFKKGKKTEKNMEKVCLAAIASVVACTCNAIALVLSRQDVAVEKERKGEVAWEYKRCRTVKDLYQC